MPAATTGALPPGTRDPHAYANGHAIRTANVRDFEEISGLIGRLIPDGPTLAVLPA